MTGTVALAPSPRVVKSTSRRFGFAALSDARVLALEQVHKKSLVHVYKKYMGRRGVQAAGNACYGAHT